MAIQRKECGGRKPWWWDDSVSPIEEKSTSGKPGKRVAVKTIILRLKALQSVLCLKQRRELEREQICRSGGGDNRHLSYCQANAKGKSRHSR